MSDYHWMIHHLQYNHFPAVDESWATPALRAIEEANDGFFTALIHCPNGEDYTVTKILDGLHLWEFLEDVDVADEEWIDDDSGYELDDEPPFNWES